MSAHTRTKLAALAGYALAATGAVLYTQLGWVVDRRVTWTVLETVALGSIAATFGGFLTVIVASAVWARRDAGRKPLKIAVCVGVLSLLLVLLFPVNVHAPTAILMLVLALSAINVLSLLILTRW